MEETFGLAVEAGCRFEEAVVRTRVSLRAHGFGVLSEMELPEEAGSPRRHLFLGVWQGLIAAANLGGPGLDVGDHLPCNFVVYEEDDSVTVAALDPAEGVAGWDAAFAEQVRQATGAALRAVAADFVAGAQEN